MNIYKIFFILFYLFFFMTTFAVAESITECDDPESPETTRLYFINGVNNSPGEVRASTDGLSKIMKPSSDLKISYMYNQSKDIYTDVLDTYKQKEHEVTLFWQWIHDLEKAPQYFKDLYINQSRC